MSSFSSAGTLRGNSHGTPSPGPGFGCEIGDAEAAQAAEEAENDMPIPYSIIFNPIPAIGAFFLHQDWLPRSFSLLSIPVAALVPLLSSLTDKSAFACWLGTVVLLLSYTTLVQSSCWLINCAQLQTAFCSAMRGPHYNMPHTYTHSLFEDLIKTPRGNMNLTDQVFEYHSAFQNITILSRLGLLIEMQPGGFVLAPWLSDRKWQNGKKFTEAFDRLLNLSINSSIMAMELPRAYVRALDDTARYSKNVMEALYPRIPNLFTWYDKNAGIYYPQRAEHLMSVYIDYHTVMRGTIRALLEAHVELHRKFDAIASELQTISIAVDFDNTLPRYKARQSKWQNSSKGYYIPLLNPYARRLAVAEAYDYFVVLNETLVRTFDMVKRSECELSCTLPRVATYQSEAYGPPDVADSVEEVRRLERNLSPMATQEQTALKLRDYFQVGARQCEDVIERLSAAWLRKQREASWVLWQKLKKPPPTPRKRRAASATVVDKQTSGTTAAETGTGAGVDDTASSTIEEPESSTPEETESRVTDEPESSATDEPEHSTADEEEECCTEEEECSADD